MYIVCKSTNKTRGMQTKGCFFYISLIFCCLLLYFYDTTLRPASIRKNMNSSRVKPQSEEPP